MTREDQKDLLSRILGGESAASIAKDYGLTPEAIRRNAVSLANQIHPYAGWTLPKIKAHREEMKVRLRAAA